MSTAGLLWRFAFTRGRSRRYGPHRSQRGDLHLPSGAGPHPVLVLVHGGSWRSRYGKRVMRALAHDLVARGWAVWNVEYRRVGEGGGWPQTFEDVAAAIDRLAGLEPSLDLGRVALLGHSAGGHLALWAAGRGESAVAPRAVVALAGVCDLAGGYRAWRGGAVLALMGASPEAEPERYAHADPMARLPPAMPVLLVHGVRDEVVSVKFSRAYAEAARAAGGEVELHEVEGEAGRHRAHVDPRGASWEGVVEWLGRAVARTSASGDPAGPAAGARAAAGQPASERASSTSSLTP